MKWLQVFNTFLLIILFIYSFFLKSYKKNTVFYICILILYGTNNIGLDIKNYFQMYETLNLTFDEIIFKYLFVFFRTINIPFFIFLFILGLINFKLLNSIIKVNKNNKEIIYFIMLSYPMLAIHLNTLRASMASMVMLTIFLKNNYLYLLAPLFHKSSLIIIIYPILNIFNINITRIKNRIYILISIICGILFRNYIYLKLLQLTGYSIVRKFIRYLEYDKMIILQKSPNDIFLLRIIDVILIVFTIYTIDLCYKYMNKMNIREKKGLRFVSIITYISLFFFISKNYIIANRILSLTIMINILLLEKTIFEYDKKNKKIKKIIIFFIGSILNLLLLIYTVGMIGNPGSPFYIL